MRQPHPGPGNGSPQLQNKGWERAWLPAELPGGWGWSRAGGAQAQGSGLSQAQPYRGKRAVIW